MNKLVEMLQQDFMRNVLAGTALVAGLSGYLGVFIVLRRSVFVGAALAQISSLGVALALVSGGLAAQWVGRELDVPHQPFALALTVGVSALFATQHREHRLPRETVIGIAYAAAAALAILVVALSPHAESEVLNLMFGNVLAIGGGDVIELAAVVAAVGVVHWLFHKEFVFASFDPETARALGVRAQRWNIVLFLTIGVTISLAIRAAGALVVFNFLVLPAATALLLCGKLRTVFCVSVIVAVACGVAGIALSYVADLPTGPTIVAVNATMVLFAVVGTMLWRIRSATQ